MSLLKFKPGQPAHFGAMHPFKFSSFIGPCREPIMFFLPEYGIPRFFRKPRHSNRDLLMSHVFRGKPALHLEESSEHWQCVSGILHFLFSFHTCTWFWRISCLRWTFCKYFFNQTRLDLYIRAFEDVSVTGVHLEDAEVNFVRSAGVSIKSILFSYCCFQALSVSVCRLCHPGKSSYTCLHTCALYFAYSKKKSC